MTYRLDIDGLRGLVVIAVILFHIGVIPNGYLGVDVFFVISGYLITNILYKEVLHNDFSIWRFYERRIRRIIPLVLVVTSVALLSGMILMLPDDLENLCQSVVATNVFGNNILASITSKDYWAIKNEYKPLIHTWSLGIEEQFYLLYPFIFLWIGKSQRNKRRGWIFWILRVLTVFSFCLFITNQNLTSQFYFLPYRFFELSLGGVCAIWFKENQRMNFRSGNYVLYVLLFLLIIVIGFDPIKSHELKISLVSVLSCGILVLGKIYKSDVVHAQLLSNRLLVWIGKISFSLYMWHQVVFAFARYAFMERITSENVYMLLFIVISLSVITYYFVEQPFRGKKIKVNILLPALTVVWLLITGAALYIYFIGGVIRDVPQLGIKKAEFSEKLNFFDRDNNIHIRYNEDVRKLDKPFTERGKIRILVVGNSYARDFVNILLESHLKESLDISYFDTDKWQETVYKERIEGADYIFYAMGLSYQDKDSFLNSISKFEIDKQKLWVVGTKDFGFSNGLYYNKFKDNTSCSTYRTSMKGGVLELNNKLKMDWGNRYIDLIGLISDGKGDVLVYTPDCKFISQDTMHFTRFGASYFAGLLEPVFEGILGFSSQMR